MNNTLLTALITLLGSSIGTIGGILASSKLTNFRLSKLEKKVEKHNNLVERMYKVEGRIFKTESDIEDIKKDIVKN